MILNKNRRMYLFIVIAFKNVYNLVDISLFDCFVETFNRISVGANFSPRPYSMKDWWKLKNRLHLFFFFFAFVFFFKGNYSNWEKKLNKLFFSHINFYLQSLQRLQNMISSKFKLQCYIFIIQSLQSMISSKFKLQYFNFFLDYFTDIS